MKYVKWDLKKIRIPRKAKYGIWKKEENFGKKNKVPKKDLFFLKKRKWDFKKK